MTKRHISDAGQRRSKRYIALHDQLRAECEPELGKQERKRQASAAFRSQGDR